MLRCWFDSSPLHVLNITEDIEVAYATVADAVARLERLGNAPTAGPAEHELVPEAGELAPHPAFADGYWSKARRVAAHPRRVGGTITPIATVVHTTDMLPEEWDALLRRWQEEAGEGACATFLIGRTPEHGTIQFCPITRNANHAGGPGGGMYVINGRQVHPNLITNGIEIHCAGGVHLVGGVWRLVEDGKAHGLPLPSADVVPDPQRPGRGWHVITDYQRETVLELLADLDQAQAPLPAGTTTRAFGEVPTPFTVMPTARVVTHAQLDPVHRADPWLPVCEVLRAR